MSGPSTRLGPQHRWFTQSIAIDLTGLLGGVGGDVSECGVTAGCGAAVGFPEQIRNGPPEGSVCNAARDAGKPSRGP